MTDWRAQAACRGQGPRLFVPAVEDQFTVRVVSSLCCDHCPVRPQCLQYAMDTHAEGIWAGTTTVQRRAMGAPRT